MPGPGRLLAQAPDPLTAAVNRATADLAAAQKAATEAETALAQAQKELTEKTAAARAAAQKAASSKAKADRAAAAEKAAAEKTAASDKAAAERAAAARTTAEKNVSTRATATRAAATRLATARAALQRATREKSLKEVADVEAAVVRAEDDKAAAERTLQQKITAVNAAAQAARTAKAAADRAATEARNAQAALDKATGSARPAVEKVFRERTAAAKAAADRATAAQAALERATADRKAAEEVIAGKDAAIQAALAKATPVRFAADGGLKTISESDWSYARARHLLYRAGFGGTPDEVARLHAMGPHRAVQHLVYYSRIPAPDIPFTATLPEPPQAYERRLPASEQNKINARRQTLENQQLQGIRTWWLKRMVESPRPLQEKLTLFWHGHFACEYETVLNSYFMYQQNQMFREHAAGSFRALLHGLVHDATMLRYLNNDTNVKGHPNENLAREIMELFALGLDQGYTEFDIREAARALTGYTYDYRTAQFRFTHARHDTGDKTIFGQTGPWTGDDLVELLLRQPHTARFIARKLFTFFAHENPDADTVEKLAAVLRVNNYDLGPMLENLFLSEEFYSPRAMGTQIKGPVQLVVGALRELGVKDASYAPIINSLRIMGQDLLQPPNVKGWDGGRTWINANRVFVRYNVMADLIESAPRTGGQRGVDFVDTVLAGKTFQSPAEVVDYLTRCCLAAPLSPAKRQALVDFLGSLPPQAEWQARRQEVNARLTALVVILVGSPEYQLT
jgi:hypothetical protein